MSLDIRDMRQILAITQYGSFAKAAEALGVASSDALFVRVPKCHASLVQYVGFALFMSRRVEDALRVMARAHSDAAGSKHGASAGDGAAGCGTPPGPCENSYCQHTPADTRCGCAAWLRRAAAQPAAASSSP